MKPKFTNAEGNEVTYVISDSVQLAGFGLLIVLTLILVNKPVWKYVFAILLIFSFTPFVNFYHQTFSFGIGIIQFELTALSILILHLILNPEVFNSFKAILKSKPESEASKKVKFESSVNGFKQRFDKKSTSELMKIVEQNKLVPEAIEAARQLLKDRQH